jgi:hypothetical protein
MARTGKQRNTDRQALLAALKAKQKREERRRRLWIYGTGSVVLLALAVTVTSVFVVNQQDKAAQAAAASKPIDGVQSFTGLTRNHTTSEVAYPQNPPVGGDHSSVWMNCGAYDHAVNNWEAVHSLEHGAVWVTYQPDLPQAQIDALTTQAASHPYELLSPYPGLPAPVVASAWGEQLTMSSSNDPRLSVFLQKYLQGPQTPEPGSPCTGGAQG